MFFFDRVEEGVWDAQVLDLLDACATFTRRTDPSHTTPETAAMRAMIARGRGGTHRAPADVALLEFPEAIAVCARLIHLAQGDVHKVVAVDEMAVECLAVLEFYKLGRGQSSIQHQKALTFSSVRGTRDRLTMGLFWAAVRSDSGSYEVW